MDGLLRITSVIVFAIALTACRAVPQTLDEQRLYIAEHRRGLVETWSVPTPPEPLAEQLYLRMRQCWDHSEDVFVRGQDTPQGGVTGGTIELTYNVRRYGDPAADVTSIAVQMVSSGGGPASRGPEGGQFLWHVDIAPQPDGSLIEFYGTTHRVSVAARDGIRDWSEGRPAACPPLD